MRKICKFCFIVTSVGTDAQTVGIFPNILIQKSEHHLLKSTKMHLSAPQQRISLGLSTLLHAKNR
ncbi:MAG: 6-phosphogluconolactonase [Prevotellaceae bacterium]|nr:6-phosphogluconolactonase [Prevotellaceae bacterium]